MCAPVVEISGNQFGDQQLSDTKIVCQHCGKTKGDFDDPDDGKRCLSFYRFSPAPGDWACQKRSEEKEG